MCLFTFVLEVGSVLACLFDSVQATKKSIQIVLYVHKEKQVIDCLFCFSG